MDLFEIFTFAGIMGTFVGVGIAVAAYFNGKHIKATEGRVLSILEGLKETLAGVMEMLRKMDERAEERHRERVETVRR